ncbi:MAG: alginate export family protein [Candidatus Omnitrophica bacterium]|nr:alginate export family protein [Candidatus Omnitrophota bacterium]
MSKRLILILALVFVVGTACAAYAEVQNVKVSGDINMMALTRDRFSLTNGPAGDKNNDNEGNFLSQIRVRIDADLTDNVMATVRLINERAWNTERTTEGSGDTKIDLDLAYVTLKEFLYSPLSITVGRQELRYGNGLIIGNARNYNTNVLGGVPGDLTERKAFDAVKAVLNYDPLVIDLIASRISYTTPTRNDAQNLLGVNAKYDLDKTTSIEGYFFNKQSRNKSGINNKADQVYTVGALVSAEPITDLKASVEGAYQFGRYNQAAALGVQPMAERSAFAVQAKANYALPFEKTKKWSPSIGAEYTYLSGNKDNKLEHQWDTMFYDQALSNIVYAIVPFTNLQAINLMGSMKPVEDVILSFNYGMYFRAQGTAGTMNAPYVDTTNTSYGAYTMTDKKFLGNELDLTAVYNYTEDVQFGLTAGWFKPGKAFSSGTTDNRHDAAQLIGSMKVTF